MSISTGDDHPSELLALEESFVALWRSMASLWGISPTMAEIHGLLYISGEALSMDDVMERLRISRGNASMNLSRLVDWGLVHRAHKRGDRREYFESLSDVWEILTQIAAQRKRREIDPILTTLRKCEETLASETAEQSVAHQEKQRRVNELLSVLTWMDHLAQRFFESQRGLRQAMQLLTQNEEQD